MLVKEKIFLPVKKNPASAKSTGVGLVFFHDWNDFSRETIFVKSGYDGFCIHIPRFLAWCGHVVSSSSLLKDITMTILRQINIIWYYYLVNYIYKVNIAHAIYCGISCSKFRTFYLKNILSINLINCHAYNSWDECSTQVRIYVLVNELSDTKHGYLWTGPYM